MDDDTFKIVADIDGGNPQCMDSLFLAPFVPPLIALRIVTQFVGDAIYLNRQPVFEAKEIECVQPKGMLAAKLKS